MYKKTMKPNATPVLTLITQSRASAKKPCRRNVSAFRSWIEEATYRMILIESTAPIYMGEAANARLRQLRRRFIVVQNVAYLHCLTLELNPCKIAKQRAAARIPHLMTLMARIRSMTERMLAGMAMN